MHSSKVKYINALTRHRNWNQGNLSQVSSQYWSKSREEHLYRWRKRRSIMKMPCSGLLLRFETFFPENIRKNKMRCSQIVSSISWTGNTTRVRPFPWSHAELPNRRRNLIQNTWFEFVYKLGTDNTRRMPSVLIIVTCVLEANICDSCQNLKRDFSIGTLVNVWDEIDSLAVVK